METLGDIAARLIRENNLGDLPEAEELPPPLCDYCNDMGWFTGANIPVGHPKFGKMFPCPYCERGRQAQLALWERRLREVGLPKAYADLTFQTFDDLPDEYKKGKLQGRVAAELFAYSPDCMVSLQETFVRLGKAYPNPQDYQRNWLVFQGQYGCGKTGLAAAITNAKMDANQSVLYMRCLDFIENVQRCYRKDYTGLPAEEIIGEFRDAPVLILDDMNVEIDSDNRKEIMEKVIRARHDHNRPTVITCNATQKQMEEFWGKRIVSVILGKAHWIPMGGTPLRQELPPAVQTPF